MSIKKALLLAAMALSTMAAAITPASAFAEGNGVLTDPPGTPVAGARTISLTGVTKFNTLGSGIECVVHATTTYDGDSTGEVHFEVTIATCKGFGATFTGCELEKITNTPAGKTDFTWETHLTKTPLGILITNPVVSSNLKNCGSDKTITTSYPKGIKASPTGGKQPIESVTLSSTGGTASINGGANLPCVSEGTLEVTPKGTYTIS
jgi:hypothetical protein